MRRPLSTARRFCHLFPDGIGEKDKEIRNFKGLRCTSVKMCNFAIWHIRHIRNNGKDYSSKYRNSSLKYNEEDYISLTDMARSQMQEHIIFRWLSLKSTIEYLGEWEMLYNPDFNCTEFGTIKNAAGSNNFVLSVKTWLERTNAIGIRSKAGRYGGTYAHRDIAYHY